MPGVGRPAGRPHREGVLTRAGAHRAAAVRRGPHRSGGAAGKPRRITARAGRCPAEEHHRRRPASHSGDARGLLRLPAHIVYAANFEVWVDGDRIAADQMGIAHAKGCRSIPPCDVKVAFHKPVDGGRFAFVNGMCLGQAARERFARGRCTPRVPAGVTPGERPPARTGAPRSGSG
ncbi:hypothetical protein [Rhizohabitans arisaemae]|uniref:hypothetical protein n=1 Tax=Rhizohabitans arisaemae TaxID=2720610 RepID=UPI0024B2330F|nr:hypothetical protein [Rhizohabitans arisaemae]